MVKKHKAELGGVGQKSTGAAFRRRYDELEKRRAELLRRLSLLAPLSGRDARYSNALKLLHGQFGKASLAQRASILQAAAWLIDLLEHLPFII